MKLDFLKTLQEVQPCGLRPVMDILDESYPVMAFSDWKELAIQLIDAGFVKRHNNGQYQITPAGKEAIKKGEYFIDEASEQNDEEQPDPQDTASSRPALDHPWRAPLSPEKHAKKATSESEREAEVSEANDDTWMLKESEKVLDPFAGTESRTDSQQKQSSDCDPAPEVKMDISGNLLHDFSWGLRAMKQQAEPSDGRIISLPVKDADQELAKMSVDQLLIVFNLGKQARNLIETRLREHSFLSDEEPS